MNEIYVAIDGSKLYLNKGVDEDLFYIEGMPNSAEDTSKIWKFLDKPGIFIVLNNELCISQ